MMSEIIYSFTHKPTFLRSAVKLIITCHPDADHRTHTRLFLIFSSDIKNQIWILNSSRVKSRTHETLWTPSDGHEKRSDICRRICSVNPSHPAHITQEMTSSLQVCLTMSECLLADSSPEPYPELRALMAPLWEWDGVINPCMSAWAPGIAVDGPTAWLLNTWMASSKRSSLSSIRLCYTGRKQSKRSELHHVYNQWTLALLW